MDRRVIVFFCLLTAVRSIDAQKKPVITVDAQNMLLKCQDGTFDGQDNEIKMSYETSGPHTCKSDECNEDTCPKALVKIRSSDHLIQPDMSTLVSVIVSNIVVTILIGWAVYSICAQPKTRGGYQGNKASDRVNLINNHSQSGGGDTYQPLNTRADEYSTLQTPRKHKNKQSV